MIDDLQTPKHKTNHIKYRRCFPQYLLQITLQTHYKLNQNHAIKIKRSLSKHFFLFTNIFPSHFGKSFTKMEIASPFLILFKALYLQKKTCAKKR